MFVVFVNFHVCGMMLLFNSMLYNSEVCEFYVFYVPDIYFIMLGRKLLCCCWFLLTKSCIIIIYI